MGITFNRWNWIFNLSVPKGETRYYSRMKFDALLPLGISEVEHNIFYHVKPESQDYIKKWISENRLDNKKIIIFSPGTPVKRKQWNLDCYAELADMIQNKLDLPVVLLWGPGEKEDVIYIKNKMKTTPIMALPTTFNQAGALLNYAELLVTNDGGINHLAVSQEVPSIAIFGRSSNPKKWCAWHKPIHFCIRASDYKHAVDNRFNISADYVFQKVVELRQIIEKNIN
jgi:ADP-heptose:LPS heptosyltransferase